MRKSSLVLFSLLLASMTAAAQGPASLSDLLGSLPEPHDYVLKRVSSYDRSGGNADARRIAPGETLTLLDEPGPG